ncbi:uncharacterized protein RJT20DRAFT_127194 [Scheffersomyces xylosifermentans]|uniref:uncharacterized protein n=1 Tax=Scheffersomyces xylosifermentans TaxID=1304137 RepID=UPI00315CEA06
MSSSLSDAHPLRPYYDHDSFNAGYSVIFKPGVGLIDTESNKRLTQSLSSNAIEQTINASVSGIKKGYNPGGGLGIHGDKRLSLGSSGNKNYVYDLEFQEYFDLNNLGELFKNLVWNFVKNYCKVLLSQPLEIARLVLQVGEFNFETKSKSKSLDNSKRLLHESTVITDLSETEDTSDYEINYFESTGTDSVSGIRNRPIASSPKKRKTKTSNSTRKHKKNKIQPISMHTMDIMSAIATKDGPFALFRGINASFIHQTLSHTIEAWITGFISPFLGIPDPFFLDLTHSNDPFRSLWLSVSACVLTGLILMPLDLIKVRLMITQFNKPIVDSVEGLSSTDSLVPNMANSTKISAVPSPVNTRSVRESIRNYPVQYLISPPPSIAFLTILHQFSISIFRKTAPYILFIKFNIDSYSSPNVYTFVNLLSLILEFFIKLPVENLLRKEQVRFLLKPKTLEEDRMRVLTIDNPEESLIVDFNNGWTDKKIEDDDEENDEQDLEPESLPLLQRIQRLGLLNGWRVGVLNVIGFWGYNILKSNGAELKEERL